jgi:hypothetical protein
MDALEFMKELKRICNSRACDINCPVYKSHFCTVDHKARTENSMAQAINIVEKWSKDNPIEVDWFKVPRNTPVLVRDVVDGEWQEEYFCAYFPKISNQFITFDMKEQYATEINYWRYCKLAPEVDLIPYLKEVK